MKLNKWTLGLAAVGVVSLASAVNAEEMTSNTVLTSLSSTTLSGYVDTSAQWNFGTGNQNNPAYSFGGDSKADGFNLNVVQLSLNKSLDESEWASGYHVDLWMGPDANNLGTQSVVAGGTADFAIRQAYVSLRTPVGNGIEWKVGVFDTVIGYESVASPNNPNYTRSYGQTIEPQTHTGILGSYRVNDLVSVAAGVANTVGPVINSKAHGPNVDYSTFPATVNPTGPKAESYKTYMASIALTAPESFGFLAGSTLYGGIVNGFSEGYNANQTSYYAGSTIATPVAGLRFGAAFDYLNARHINGETWTLAGYASFQATEKLSLHGRVEYLRDRGEQRFFAPDTFGYSGASSRVVATTLTAQYDLWQNVLSRVELRWDHSADGTDAYGPSENLKNAVMLAANVIYKF
ncbi:MAG: outer membrane beta-barrel protein [Verrucomicrobiota bacterium]